jgi:hypothetical protein
VGIGVGREILVKPAFLRLAGNNDSTVIAPLREHVEAVKLKTALLLERAVALDAIDVQNRLHLGRPKRGRLRPPGDSGSGNNAPEDMHEFAAHFGLQSLHPIDESAQQPLQTKAQLRQGLAQVWPLRSALNCSPRAGCIEA